MKSEVKEKKVTPKFDVSKFENAEPEESFKLDKYVFIPTWDNKPEEQPAVLTINGIPCLTHQNTSAIIAHPGLGKSALCEAAAASYLNPKADCLGFQVSEKCKGIIYVDNERTNIDVWNCFNRMCNRAGIKYGHHYPGVIIAGLRGIPRLKERLQTIEHLLQTNPCSLLLLDGAGDLVTDTNDLFQAIECRVFLREITVKYDLSVLTTLHPNPGSFKPRGHIGSEIHRESECVMLAKSYEGDYKILTSEFDHGKNRNNTPINSGYKWSEEKHMFISVDYEEVLNTKQNLKDAKHKSFTEKIAKTVLPASSSLSFTDLIAGIMQTTSKSDATAKRIKKNMEGWKIIIKGVDGNYRLNNGVVK